MTPISRLLKPGAGTVRSGAQGEWSDKIRLSCVRNLLWHPDWTSSVARGCTCGVVLDVAVLDIEKALHNGETGPTARPPLFRHLLDLRPPKMVSLEESVILEKELIRQH